MGPIVTGLPGRLHLGQDDVRDPVAEQVPPGPVAHAALLQFGSQPGQIVAGVLLDHYGATMHEIRATGYVSYWVREFRPYLKAAASQFSPRRVTLTERMLRGARS